MAWRGVLQSAGIERAHESHGVLIEATSTPPGMGSMVLPGRRRSAAAGARRRRARGHARGDGGRRSERAGARPHGAARWSTGSRRQDGRRLLTAVEMMGRVLLAAGAREVQLGGDGPPVTAPARLAAAVGAHRCPARCTWRRFIRPAAAPAAPIRPPSGRSGGAPARRRRRGHRRRLAAAELSAGEPAAVDHGGRLGGRGGGAAMTRARRARRAGREVALAWDQPVLDREHGGAGPGVQADLAVHAGQVVLHGPRREDQRARRSRGCSAPARARGAPRPRDR